MEKEEVEEVVGDKGEGEEFGDGSQTSASARRRPRVLLPRRSSSGESTVVAIDIGMPLRMRMRMRSCSDSQRRPVKECKRVNFNRLALLSSLTKKIKL